MEGYTAEAEAPAEAPPIESVSEAPQPEEATPEVSPPPPEETIPPEKPKLRRRQTAKKPAQQSLEPPYLEMPEVNNDFWGQLLATQRAMERQTRSQRISNFAIA